MPLSNSLKMDRWSWAAPSRSDCHLPGVHVRSAATAANVPVSGLGPAALSVRSLLRGGTVTSVMPTGVG